jgi:hypothetical protein
MKEYHAQQSTHNTKSASPPASSWGVTSVHSAHVSSRGHVFPHRHAYLVTPDGARLVGGRDISNGAFDAMCRNAEAHAAHQRMWADSLRSRRAA